MNGTDRVYGQPVKENAPVIGYLLTKPTTTESPTYQLEVTIAPPTPTNGSPIPQEQTTTITLQAPNGGIFEAGKCYTIKLGIYAMQEVEATATLTPWEEVAEFEIPVE